MCFNNSNAALMKFEIGLFGINLDQKVTERYLDREVACYLIDNIKGEHNGIKINTELLRTGLVGAQSSDGNPISPICVEPRVDNPDFINFSVSFYPDSKEIHTVRAVHRKVFSGSFNPRESGCAEHRDNILQAIIDSKLKKGFKYSRGYDPVNPVSIISDSDNYTWLKKWGYEIKVYTDCDNRSNNDYFLKISISNYSYKISSEESGKAKKKKMQKSDANKSGL